MDYILNVTSFFALPHQRLFKRLITEDVGADLNEGYDTFIEKKGEFCWKNHNKHSDKVSCNTYKTNDVYITNCVFFFPAPYQI